MSLSRFPIFLFFIFLLSLQNLFSFSEPSGITINRETGFYYVIGDEGHIYEMDENLNILRTVFLGSFDLEAIAFDHVRKTLFCLNERDLSLIEIDPQSFNILKFYPLELEKVKKRKFSQFESLTIVDGLFYLATSTTKKKKQFGSLFSYNLENNEMIYLIDLPMWDISGLSYGNGYFYLISDDEDKIARYSIESDDFTSINLPGDHQEGIVFTPDNTLRIYDEDGTTFEITIDLFNE